MLTPLQLLFVLSNHYGNDSLLTRVEHGGKLVPYNQINMVAFCIQVMYRCFSF